MKFESRKAPLFMFVTYSLVSFCGAAVVIGILKNSLSLTSSIPYIILLLVSGLVLWFFHSTSYELTASELRYKSGPIKGSININNISEIISGDTLWVGLKPATAMYGLTIKYDKFNEIYISPELNDEFIEKIKEINPDIEVIKKK